MMRIVLANPNTSQAMTDRMAASAQGTVGPGDRIIPLTAPRGFPYISSLAEAQVAGAICLEMLADAPPCDAAIIAAFGDPGLQAARSLFPFPIVGMAESAILTAVQLGRTFAIVTFTAAMRPWYMESVAMLGLGPRFLGVRTPGDGSFDVADVAVTHRSVLCDLALAAAQDGADVVILGGAPLAGLAAELSGELPVLLVDPIIAATRQAMALAGQGPFAAGRLSMPAPKSSSGLPVGLARCFARPNGRRE